MIELAGITRSFSGRRVLDGVDLRLAPGEIVGLLGENGAGKTTLMRLLYGLLEPEEGEIRIDGEVARMRSPRDARRHGIAMVHQHFTLVPAMTVRECIALSEGRSWLWTATRELEKRLGTRAAELGLEVRLDATVADLAVGARQRVEILKALLGEHEIRALILDEPTASLTPDESADLFRVARRLTSSGAAVVLISHKLREVMAATDRVVVLRGGRVVAERLTRETDARELGALMVGSATGRKRAAATEREPAIVERVGAGLRVDGLEVAGAPGAPDAVRGVSLAVAPGEIVGIAGVDGNGQAELVEAIVGLRRPRAGVVRIGEHVLGDGDAARAIAAGVAHIPADRHRYGLVGGLDLRLNLVLKHRARAGLRQGPLVNRATVDAFATERVATFGVRPAAIASHAAVLSGGNQQRLVLARELAFAPRVVVAESPSRGLDVAATDFVHQQLRAARAAGAAVLLVSPDLDEILAVADRIVVMFAGRLRDCPGRDRAVLGGMLGGVA